MHLHLTIVLFFILLTGGFSLKCYKCNEELGFPCKQTTDCYEPQRCANSRGVRYRTGMKYAPIKGDCVQPQECKSWSIATTTDRIGYSTECCDTDLCNKKPAPELNTQPNGKKCYTCNWESCSLTVNCWGNENYCFTATSENLDTDTDRPSMIVKGCASKFACEASGQILIPVLRFDVNATCCEGNLCNAAERVTRSFLFLCCSVFYFMLH